MEARSGGTTRLRGCGYGCCVILIPMERFFPFCAKWALGIGLVAGGIWFIVIGLRGDRKQVDKTLEETAGGITLDGFD